jgi:hypothetical protein
MGPLGVPRHLAFPPRGQIAVKLLQKGGGLGIKGLGLFGDVHLFIRPRQCAQFFRLAFNFGQGFFEIQILGHWVLRLFAMIYGGHLEHLQRAAMC